MFDKETAIDTSDLAGKSIYVFSDLHSGDGTARDNFKFVGNDAPLRECIATVRREDPDAAIVILGDFFEFWQSPFGEVILNNLPLMDFLVEAKALYILGNHDNDLLAFLKKDGRALLRHPFFSRMGTGVLLEDRGAKRIALVHGHEVDPFNCSPVPTTGRALCILAGIVEEKVGKPFLDDKTSVEDALEQLGELVLQGMAALWTAAKTGRPIDFGPARTPSSSPDLAMKNLQAWDAERQNGHFDLLVCGHTHQPGFAKDRSGVQWYFNSGCWAKRFNTYLKIDREGLVEVFEWKEGKSIPFVKEISYL